MKHKIMPWSRIIGLAGLSIILAWLIFRMTGDSSYLKYSKSTYSFFASPRVQADGEDIPQDVHFEIHSRWVSDVSADKIPDLVFASREKSPIMSRLQGMNDWVWILRIYSGADGSLIHDAIWDDPDVRLFKILGSNGSVGSIRYLVHDHDIYAGKVGTQSHAEDFRPSSVKTVFDWDPIDSVYTSLNGPIIGHDFPQVSIAYLDSTLSPTSIDLPRGSKSFFVPSDGNGVPSRQIAKIWMADSTKLLRKKSAHYLQLIDLPGGRIQTEIELETASFASFDPKSILAMYDVNQDGIGDWLIEHNLSLPGGDYARDYAWFDGKSGHLINEATKKWKRDPTALSTLPFPTTAKTKSGLFECYVVGTPSPTAVVVYRPWHAELPAWTIELDINPEWFPGGVNVTEFQDLDGDGHPEFGIYVDCLVGGKSIPGMYILPDIEMEAHLVSGATGKPLMETLKAK